MSKNFNLTMEQFKVSIKSLPFYTLDEVYKHSNSKDCWVILTDIFDGISERIILNLSGYIKNHPGGKEILLPYIGGDCTDEFLKYHVETNSDIYNIVMKLTIGKVGGISPKTPFLNIN